MATASKKTPPKVGAAASAGSKTQPSSNPPADKIMVAALSITSSREGFRRAGYVFGKEPVTIALSDLSKAQIKQLKDEPLLNVTDTEIEATE